MNVVFGLFIVNSRLNIAWPCEFTFWLQYEVLEILDLPDPDITPASSRTQLRLECEVKDFSDEHYLADRVYRNYIDELIAFVTVWEQYRARGTSGKVLFLFFCVQLKFCYVFSPLSHIFILILFVSVNFIFLQIYIFQ
jgi:hypothetical protein